MAGKRLALSIVVLALAALACGVSPAPVSQTETDRVATRVAEDLAVAATLTAAVPDTGAQENQPVTQPTTVQVQAPQATNTSPPPPPQQPTNTFPPPPPPEEEENQQAEESFGIIPAFGSLNGMVGDVVVPGESGVLAETPVFQDGLVFRLRVYDPDEGNDDGDGVQSVDFSITDPEGQQVHSRTEQTAGYCVFGGGEPYCSVYDFAENDYTWPSGDPIRPGIYEAGITVHTDDPNKEGAFWGFNFEIPESALP